jgi:hypothetical protein
VRKVVRRRELAAGTSVKRGRQAPGAPRHPTACGKCAGLSWRVIGARCQVCGLDYATEQVIAQDTFGESSIARGEWTFRSRPHAPQLGLEQS